jgi:hypothetical protein
VLVGLPDTRSSGLVAYDLGKETGRDGLLLLRQGHILAETEPIVRAAIGSIRLYAPNEAKLFMPYYEAMKDEEHLRDGTFADPGQEGDRLYQAGFRGADRLVARDPRPAAKRTRVWYGSIGSGEKLMRNAAIRDELRDKHDIIGLEMEAAGTMNRIPVGVIRGVCDYADMHKNWEWQPYAAAMAAAYAKAVLAEIPGSRKDHSQPEMSWSSGERGSSNSFSGQGNQNIGSGSISIGGGQYFNHREL